MIGKVLGNRYEILEKLGGGGMAIVYKGRDTFLNRYVTIKIMRPEFTSDEDFIRRFKREAQAVASLSHPNIVNIHDVGQEEDVHYLVMEYVQGDNLKNVIRKNGVLTPEQAVRFAIQVCEALEHAHENHIVHRDVKPQNILITDGGRAKLTDFGIALEANTSTITRTDTVVGSVHYLSPEQARGEIPTPQSDIYAVGILLYEMLTGQQPYSGDSPVAVAIKHIQETPQPVHEVNQDVPVALATIVMRAMEKKPEDRYKSAGELARYLEFALKELEDTGQATMILPTEKIIAMSGGGADPKKNSVKAPPKTGGEQRPRYWLWVTLVLLVGLLAVGLYNLYNVMNTQPFHVPNVIGDTKAEAEAKLVALKLTVSFNEDYDPEIEKGRVMAQSIGPEDAAVKPDREVKLTISKGPEMREVPNLYNANEAEAEYRLSEAGLKLARPINEIYHDEVAKGKVLQQSVAFGQQVPKGTEISITISKGPEPRFQKVPDLIRHTLDEARSILEELNLRLNEDDIKNEVVAGFKKGQITDQQPVADSEVKEGTKVSVVINNGPGPKPKYAEVRISDQIPDDGESHLVEIIVEDTQGRQVQYADSHVAGDRIVQEVTYYGSGVVEVYIDEEFIWEENLT